jgi:hypothetical protein
MPRASLRSVLLICAFNAARMSAASQHRAPASPLQRLRRTPIAIMAQLPIQSLEVVGGIRSGTGSKPAYERRVLRSESGNVQRHIAHRYSWVRRAPDFQRDTKRIGANCCIDRRRPAAGPCPQIAEIPGISGPLETKIVVEAEAIFDIPANGIYYANLVVTGVPVIPPTISNSAQFLH